MVAQIRLLPDPQPLVERLGRDFFRQLPTHPGVYLLRDAAEQVLYVGKAKNLRRRLGSYRVANSDRLPRRLLRLLHLARRVEWEACPNEASAFARERELLLALRPRFNRAGVWPAPPRFLAWRVTAPGIELAVVPALTDGWDGFGPLGAGARWLRAALVRLLWCGLFPDPGLASLPAGWFHGRLPDGVTLRLDSSRGVALNDLAGCLRALLAGEPASFVAWLEAVRSGPPHPFEQRAIASDLEVVAEFSRARLSGGGLAKAAARSPGG